MKFSLYKNIVLKLCTCDKYIFKQKTTKKIIEVELKTTTIIQ